MAQNSTQITGIAFSELKADKKQLVTEKQGKMFFFVKISIGLSCRRILGSSRGRRSGGGYFIIPSRDII